MVSIRSSDNQVAKAVPNGITRPLADKQSSQTVTRTERLEPQQVVMEPRKIMTVAAAEELPKMMATEVEVDMPKMMATSAVLEREEVRLMAVQEPERVELEVAELQVPQVEQRVVSKQKAMEVPVDEGEGRTG